MTVEDKQVQITVTYNRYDVFSTTFRTLQYLGLSNINFWRWVLPFKEAAVHDDVHENIMAQNG